MLMRQNLLKCLISNIQRQCHLRIISVDLNKIFSPVMQQVMQPPPAWQPSMEGGHPPLPIGVGNGGFGQQNGWQQGPLPDQQAQFPSQGSPGGQSNANYPTPNRQWQSEFAHTVIPPPSIGAFGQFAANNNFGW